MDRKAIDQTRPVISNDGWEHAKTDLPTIHYYAWSKNVLKDRCSIIESTLDTHHAGKAMYARGWKHEGQPVILSEMGGISYRKSKQEGWGYSNASSDDFLLRYHQVISAMLETPLIQGFVYTQITDVEQEINGLLTYARQPKVDLGGD